MKNDEQTTEYEKYDLAILFVMALILLAFSATMFLVLFLSIYTAHKNLEQQISETESIESVLEGESISTLPVHEVKLIRHADLVPIKDISEIAIDKYESKFVELNNGRADKESWYLEYKELLEEYNEYLDIQTVYDIYTKDEIYLIQRTVETETFQCSFDSKVNVASVIFNRLNDERFGKNVNEVITSPRQFAYWRTNISESTRLAVEYAFEIEDTTGGCIAFRSDVKPEKWGKWEYVFSDNAVHHFYREVINE